MRQQVAILAAGRGTRLGRPHPKPLPLLDDGRTLLGGVLWMNGDVVFEQDLLALTMPLIEADQSFIAVNTAKVDDEEVKYTVDQEGWIRELSKSVVGGLGEAVGVNYVSAADKSTVIRRLAEVDEQDYFERGIEVAIEHDGAQFAALDISAAQAVEIDTFKDLRRANASLCSTGGEPRT